MELNDFNIKYKGTPLDNIIMTAWVDSMKGFNEDNKVEYDVTIKVVYVDKYGIMKCIEDNSKNFELLPKIVDHK